MPIISLTRIEKRKVSVFLSCLLIAVFCWLFFALSNDYEYKVNSRLNYINPPLNKAYHPLQEDTVTLKLRGTGWQLLFSKLKLKPRIVNVNLKPLNISNYVTISSQLSEINLQFESNQKVVSAFPDTLFFDFTRRITKRVPVRLLYKFSFIKPFGISGPIHLEPSTVIVTGAAEDLKDINFWTTDSLSLKDIDGSVNAHVSFQKGHKNNVDVYPKMVKVEVPVDEFTEKVIEIPIEIENNPGRDVKLVPERARITLLTSLSNYSKIDRESLKVNVDLDNWMKNKYSQLPLRIIKFPPFCKLVKTEPQIVDFLVKE
ncbi:YbbR-like domain-containing protein [Paradesertivirga mongoliensis]|uniref:YbbR-like domain-containing protein n=1 Tax=Paradesertivirga mongoliensis TaxID=2100740 RepID=A0ABW4ZLQ2_9SPHI|nr:YbbR-like domain-containing protein [Pedobacter mongoliensis]